MEKMNFEGRGQREVESHRSYRRLKGQPERM